MLFSWKCCFQLQASFWMNCLVIGTEDNYPSPTQRTALEPAGTAELKIKQMLCWNWGYCTVFVPDLIEFLASFKHSRGCHMPLTYKECGGRAKWNSLRQLTVWHKSHSEGPTECTTYNQYLPCPVKPENYLDDGFLRKLMVKNNK